MSVSTQLRHCALYSLVIFFWTKSTQMQSYSHLFIYFRRMLTEHFRAKVFPRQQISWWSGKHAYAKRNCLTSTDFVAYVQLYCAALKTKVFFVRYMVYLWKTTADNGLVDPTLFLDNSLSCSKVEHVYNLKCEVAIRCEFKVWSPRYIFDDMIINVYCIFSRRTSRNWPKRRKGGPSASTPTVVLIWISCSIWPG